MQKREKDKMQFDTFGIFVFLLHLKGFGGVRDVDFS